MAQTLYVTNAFSINMLPPVPEGSTHNVVRFGKADVDRVKFNLDFADDAGIRVVFAIGHQDTASLVGEMLGREVRADRVSVKLAPGDCLYVAQYTGPRLPEGATTLPEGAAIEWHVAFLDLAHHPAPTV